MILEWLFMPYKDPEKQREAQRRYEKKRTARANSAQSGGHISMRTVRPRTSSTSCAKAAWKVSQ